MKRDFSALTGEFDLLICGGGIYGAWTAYDASLRGLKVALVEQADWASATSSASSKLIHGGLRYLETYDFRLVRKALKERQMLLQAAPHRVWPLRFGVPVHAHSRNGRMKLKAGLTLYDVLAGLPGADGRHRWYGPAEFAGRFPFLDEAGLHGGFTYADAQTDDARLVLELVAGALAQGAVCVNYARVLEWEEVRGQVCGARLRDEVSGEERLVRARCCVNAAGQWLASTEQGADWCRLSKGVHLVMPGLPGNEALLLTTREDGRVFFVIPWYGRTVLGTTDTDYRGDVESVGVEAGDVSYLLSAANAYLKTSWAERDIVGSYAGLRVMKRSDAAHPSAVSRDWELKEGANGLLHAVGGKITSAREDASSIVDVVCKRLGVHVPCLTQGRDFPWKPQADYVGWSGEMLRRAEVLGVDPQSARWLIARHGVRVGQVFAALKEDPLLAARIVPELPFIGADLLVCAREEMVVRADDCLRRRMPLLILARSGEIPWGRVVEIIAQAKGWERSRVWHELGAEIKCQRDVVSV